MNKILQSTTRGQVTLPKDWRDQFGTDIFIAEYDEKKIVLKPLQKTFEETIESSWEEYQNGDIVEGSDLMKKYGL